MAELPELPADQGDETARLVSPGGAGETLPFDPESGSVADVPPHMPDQSYGPIPRDAAVQLGEADASIRLAGQLIAEVLDPLIEGTGTGIDGQLSGIHAVLGGVGGVVAHRIGEHSRAVDGQLARLVRSGDRVLAPVVDGLVASGLNLPREPELWRELADSNPGDWIGAVVPEIGRIIGVDPDPVQCDDLGNCGTSPPPPPPGGCPVVWTAGDPVPAGCECDTISFQSDAGTCVPIVTPPVPPTCPPCDIVPPPIDGQCPAPVVQCPSIPPISCPPPDPAVGGALTTISNILTNITTNPPGTSPGSAQCPPAPPVNVAVTVPPPIPPAEQPGKGIPPPDDPGSWSQNVSTFWCDPQVCQNTADIITALEQEKKPGQGGTTRGESDWWDLVSPVAANLVAQVQATPKNQSEAISQVGAGLRLLPSELLKTGGGLAFKALNAVAPQNVPNVATASYYAARIGVAEWAERQTGMPLSYLYQSDKYIFQAANPQYLPTQPSIDRLWLTGYISDGTWDCLTAAQGNTICWHDLVLESQIQRMNLGELIQLFLRKEISAQQLSDRARKVGWADTKEIDSALKLAVQIPSQSDLLRMMVRDASDELVVKKYGYDKDFEDKFKGPLKAWSEAQGVPAEIFKFFWRAHWTIPSNTQLYEMLHRLRPDRREVIDFNQLAETQGEQAAVAKFGPRPEVVEVDDVRTALEVNDLAPAWVERAIAISYHPITRTDAVRAYQIGSFDDEQLESAMLDNGYDGPTAKLLVKFYKELSARVNSNAAGSMTIRQVVGYFRAGALSRVEAERALEPLMVDADKRRQLLDRADQQVQAETKKVQLRVLRKRFIAGEDAPQGWRNEVMAVTGDGVRTRDIMDQWTAERDGRLKEATALMLGKWYDRGVISDQDVVTRLRRIGYTPADSERIAATFALDRAKRLESERRALAKEAVAEARRRKAEALKQLKENCDPPKLCNPDGTPIK